MLKFSAGAEVNYEAARTEVYCSVLQKKRQAGINGRGTASGRMLQQKLSSQNSLRKFIK